MQLLCSVEKFFQDTLKDGGLDLNYCPTGIGSEGFFRDSPEILEWYKSKGDEQMIRRNRTVFILVLMACFALTLSAHAANYKGYPRGDIFITPQELNQLIEANDPKLVVFAVAGRAEFMTGHIPGSFQIWRPDYAAPAETQGGVIDNVMTEADFTELMQGFGVDPDSKVVVYDHKYDATRIWWNFYYFGKTDVRILDGGIKGWRDAGFRTSMLLGAKPERRGTWKAKIAYPSMSVRTKDIQVIRHEANCQLWDNRGDRQFLGETTQKGATRPGRIPEAAQCDWVHFKTKANDAEWVTADEAREALNKVGFDPEKHHYFYCQSGVRTTQMIATLYALGYPMEKMHNYDDSWIGWSMDESLPAKTGRP